VKLSSVIDELVEERGLDREVLQSIIAEGVLAAFQKRYPDIILMAEYDKKSDDIAIRVQKKVVSAVQDDMHEISLRKARSIEPKVEAGAEIWITFEEPIGRVEILRAKQAIAQRIRKIESEAVYNEFKGKEGTIVTGVIHKGERAGTVVKIRDYFAFLPKSLSIPGEKHIVGYPIRALLKEVLPEPRNENQLILDRSSTDFLARLFELEIPEVFERLVEIKRIVRIPGYKSKIIVVSHDKNIDPVGTCVGVGGVRIKPILKEIEGEKIDIIASSEVLDTLVAQSLKPAQVNRVEILDNRSANVWVDEDQRSLAIGKMGQNIALACKLTGMEIHLMQPEGNHNEQQLDDSIDDGQIREPESDE
jgi:transcription termination/antitermination protein NusA